MGTDIRDQIFRKLNQKETDELITIWQTNDHKTWSETAFELIGNILQERLVDLNAIIQSNPHDTIEQSQENLIIKPEKQLPSLYDPDKTLTIVKWLDWAANTIVIIFAIIAFLNLFLINRGFQFNLQWFGNAGLLILNISVQCIISYFPLKALSIVLRILMEMEIQSRPRT